MFNAKLTDAKLLRDITTAIATIVDEATFNITPEGIKLRAMDPSRVAMIDFEWPKSLFDDYNADQPQKMCINITEMLKLLRRTSKDETVELTLDPQTNRLNVTIKGKYERTFNMPTLEATEEEVPTPKITFNVRAKVTTAGLRQAIEDALLASDHVRIELDNEKMMMRAKSDLMGAVVKFKKGSDSLLELEAKEPAMAAFSLSYLSEIVKTAAATSDIAILEFSTDMPIRINFQQPNEGKLIFYLAPRIEVD